MTRTASRFGLSRRALVLLAPLAMIIAPTSADAGGNGAQKTPMFDDQGWTCAAGDIAASDAHGFAVLNVTGAGTLVGTIALKGVEPNATYNMWITDGSTLGPCPATPHLGTLTTNGNGNGNFHFSITDVGSAPRVWVIAEGAHDVNDRYQSQAVDLG